MSKIVLQKSDKEFIRRKVIDLINTEGLYLNSEVLLYDIYSLILRTKYTLLSQDSHSLSDPRMKRIELQTRNIHKGLYKYGFRFQEFVFSQYGLVYVLSFNNKDIRLYITDDEFKELLTKRK